MPEEQQRWYAIKIFERDDKVLEKLQIPSDKLEHIEKDIKAAEKELLADYSDELKDCTISQGKVLLKLIDRETGRTSYVLVTELRGKLRAGVYQTFARLFGYNLKATYDPKNNKEDNLIERIVLSVERGKL
jgi:hypothetical protein